MNLEPRETAAVESYPTFWIANDTEPAPNSLEVPADDAYEAFVNLCEDDLPDDPTSGAELH